MSQRSRTDLCGGCRATGIPTATGFPPPLGDADFGSPITYQAAINGQFYGATHPVADGPAPSLAHSANIFSNATGAIVENAKCFWSPTAAQWTIVQSALNSGTTAFPANVGSPSCYSTTERQILRNTSVANNNSGGASAGAPAFLFIQKRSPTAPAVRQIN